MLTLFTNRRENGMIEAEIQNFIKGDLTMKKWVCTVCGYVHEGETAPEVCPLCGVGAEMFEQQED